MADRQTQYRQAKARERQAKRDAGLVPVEIWVPIDKLAEIKALADQMRQQLPEETTTA